jgi:hypothetical protein
VEFEVSPIVEVGQRIEAPGEAWRKEACQLLHTLTKPPRNLRIRSRYFHHMRRALKNALLLVGLTIKMSGTERKNLRFLPPETGKLQ